jgi:hypothetical protein
VANKIEIKRFLERKKEESIRRLIEESQQKQEVAKDLFFEAYSEKFADIRAKVVAAGVEYDKLVETITNLGIASFLRNYRSPANSFNELINKLSISQLRDNYIDIVEALKIEDSYSKKTKDCEREYDGLIAVCNANNAKDSLKIIENLGFDISEIEIKKEECTTLVTTIDVSKLFIVKGEK